MSEQNLKIVLAARPTGAVTPDHFRLVSEARPTIGAGQILVRNHYLSLDPYMRGRMNEGRSYADAQPLNEVMVGGTAGEVVESQHPQFQVGQKVVAHLGWQLFGVSDGRGVRRVDATALPLSAYLGVLGMPGVTAWYGLHQICAPKPGETLVVSAASGAVGAVVGQLGKLAGCRVAGIAGGRAKCDYVTQELGFDACIDYKATPAASAPAALAEVAPARVDCLFENVGGPWFDATLGHMNAFGRIALCGLIAGYNGEPIPIHNVRALLTERLKLQGFIVAEHLEHWPAALAELGRHVANGALKYRESIAHGLDQAPAAFIAMLAGKNFGKQVVKLI
jgi:NADPH-dependent curcumin reductase CurA